MEIAGRQKNRTDSSRDLVKLILLAVLMLSVVSISPDVCRSWLDKDHFVEMDKDFRACAACTSACFKEHGADATQAATATYTRLPCFLLTSLEVSTNWTVSSSIRILAFSILIFTDYSMPSSIFLFGTLFLGCVRICKRTELFKTIKLVMD